MRAAKLLGLIVGGAVVVVIAALVCVWLFVDPNDFKGKIESAVKDSTGRTLQLQGDIKLKVFPWIALELGPATLGNPPGFSARPFLTVQRAAVRAKLLPLLHKRLDIARIELDGLDVALEKNAQGKGNWQDLDDARTPTAAGPAAASDGTALDHIGGIKLTHALVSFAPYTLQNLSLETGSIVKGAAVPVSVHLEVRRATDALAATVDAKLDVTQQTSERFTAAAVDLNGAIRRPGSDRPIKFDFKTAALALDLQAQTLDLPAADVTFAGAHLSAALKVTQLEANPAVSGSLTLAPLIIREFLPRFGLTAPRTQDPHALMQVAASAAFAYGDHAARLDGLKLDLDDTHVTGSVDVVDLATLATNFKLNVDAIDLDRYLPPSEPTVTGKAAPASESAPRHAPIDANGTLSIGSIHLRQLDLTQLQATVATQARVLHVYPLEALVDGGHYSGDVTLDQRAAVPVLSFDEHLVGIDIGRLLAGQSGQPKKVHLSGHGTVDFKATGTGLAADLLLKTLNGRLDFNVADGAVEGIDLGYELGRAAAFINRRSTPDTPNTKRTKFDALKMSADIVGGIATTKDLTIASQALKVTGGGSLNLSTKAIDFALLADASAGNSGSVQIPVKVTGTTTDPTVRPDIEAFAKGALREKLQNALQDKLKGLFNH